MLLNKLEKPLTKNSSAKTSKVNRLKQGKIEETKLYIKEFIEKKNSRKAQQTSVVLACYLSRYKGKPKDILYLKDREG